MANQRKDSAKQNTTCQQVYISVHRGSHYSIANGDRGLFSSVHKSDGCRKLADWEPGVVGLPASCLNGSSKKMA